jgi:electron transfer flavoprotein alpha subunit
LLGAAARLAADVEGTVQAVTVGAPDDLGVFGRWGADEVIHLVGVASAEDVAGSVAREWVGMAPWAVLAPSTTWGREVAARLAARSESGLTGDAVDLGVTNGRLVAWKPAFGGAITAAITATSATQMATVRPGVLPLLPERHAPSSAVRRVEGDRTSRVRLVRTTRDDDVADLGAANAVVGVGGGVDPGEYGQLTGLLAVLGAETAASRQVTDKQWMPRARQVGITGRSISPAVYVAIGISGKFNHMVGVRSAGLVLAINSDPDAPVFDLADFGIVGDWHQVVPRLAVEIERVLPRLRPEPMP